MWPVDWFRRRRAKALARERDVFISQLTRFLSGTEGEWDWDDFESVRCRDPALEKMRQSILTCGLPPMSAAQLAASNEEMRRVLEQLQVKSATSA
jgi:hypothetical protein